MNPTVNKIVGWCLSPCGLLFAGLLVGWWLKRGRKVVVGLVLAAFWALGCGVTTRIIGVPLEGEEAKVGGEGEAWDDTSPVDAIVLLGGGIGVHEACGRAEIYSGADRAWTAARLWKRLRSKVEVENGEEPILTVSGGGARGEVAFLTDMGVDTNRIVMIEAARNTEEEAKLVMAKLVMAKRVMEKVEVEGRGNEKRRIALVTSAWHMPRAKMLFERVGFEVVPVSTDYEMHCAAERDLEAGDFFPNAEALVRNSYAVKEWVARVLYWVKYR